MSQLPNNNHNHIDTNNSLPNQNNDENKQQASIPLTPGINQNGTRKYTRNRVEDIVKIFSIIVITFAIITSTLFILILANPNSKFSKWSVEQTPLKNYLSLKNENGNGNNSSKPLNDILGLNNENNKSFEFTKSKDNKSTTEVVQNALPSVLSISVWSDSARFGKTNEISGTGYIVSTDGLVVTNKHVISAKCVSNNQNIKISGLSHDQQVFDLDLMSVDPVDDIAILKIKDVKDKLTPVTFADSSSILLGADVIAIGNVLGQLQNTVTKGIVSGLSRSVPVTQDNISTNLCSTQTSGYIDGLIQTDAAINKGNSGGPLFDSSGQIVGMNTLGSTEAQNIGLAIPSGLIVNNLNSYKANGKIIRPRLGVLTQTITSLDKQINTWLPVNYGELIRSGSRNINAVTSGSSADKAGIKNGDIILEVDGKKLVYSDNNPSPLRRIILSKQPDQEVELTVLKSKGGNEDSGFQYEPNQSKVKIKLGGVSVELPRS